MTKIIACPETYLLIDNGCYKDMECAVDKYQPKDECITCSDPDHYPGAYECNRTQLISCLTGFLMNDTVAILTDNASALSCTTCETIFPNSSDCTLEELIACKDEFYKSGTAEDPVCIIKVDR